MAIATNASSDAVAITPLRYPPETAVAAEVLVSMALRTDELSVVPMALIQKHHEAIIQPVGGQAPTAERRYVGQT